MKKFYALKTFCALFLFALIGLTAHAEDVTFDFAANEWGLPIGEGSGATADAGNITAPIVKDGVTLTFEQAGAGTSPRMWKGPQLRTYKGNILTVAAPEGRSITAVNFTVDGSSNFGFAVDGADVDLSAGWSGSAASVVFTGTKTSRLLTLTVTLDGAGGETPDPEPGPGGQRYDLFTESFADGQGDFTIDDVNVGDFYVWSADTEYGYMKASAYVSGTNHASESWLLSPVIDLTGATACQLTFTHAGNFFGTTEDMQAAVAVKARAEGSEEWADLAVTGWPAGTGWTFVDATADLSAFDGQRVQLAFVYTSTAEKAGTWEVKNLAVSGVTDEAPLVVPAPVFSPEAGTYSGSVEVSLTAQDGLAIYYTTDGSEPTTASAVYESPFTLTETATVQAIAVDAEGNASEVASAEYVIRQPLDVPEGCVGFDFTSNPWGLPVSSQEAGDFEITRVEQDGVVLTTTSGNTATRMWNDYNLGLQLRVYKNGTLTFTAPEGYNIVKVEFNASKFDLSVTDGTLIDQTWEGKAPAVTFTAGGTTNISTVILTFDSPVTGIDGVTAAPGGQTVIYTIDGRRVERAERGLYIINGRKVYVK